MATIQDCLNFIADETIYLYISISISIKVETIENNSHPKWATFTPHRWPHTAGPKMVDRWWIDENSYF